MPERWVYVCLYCQQIIRGCTLRDGQMTPELHVTDVCRDFTLHFTETYCHWLFSHDVMMTSFVHPEK